MIDVNKITSTLARLPDAQLQQYAQMHKADPYIMSLAMSESNRRKEVRAASQAPAQQEQPKVVDQGIAAMAPQAAPQQAQAMPEEQGIGQLPAGNMNFAGGGIIAFADGGDVERYQSQGLVQNPLAQKYELESQEMGMGTRMQYSPEVRAYAQAQEQASKQGYAERERARMLQGPYGATAPAAPVPPTAAQGAPTAAPVSTADMAARASASPYTSGAATETASLLGRYPSVKAPAKEAGAPPVARPPAAAPGIGMPSYAGLDVGKMTEKALKSAEEQPNIFAKDIGEIGKAKVKAKEEEVTGLEAIQQKFDNIFKGRKERQDTKEGEIAKMGDQNLGLALLYAGAEMMQTPGGVGVAFGKGVGVGTKQYVAGLDKINSAKDKLSDARDRLEDIEAQRGEMSARELFKARNDVKNTQISAKEDLVKSNMQMYGLNREQALKQVDNQIKVSLSEIETRSAAGRTAAQIASAERIATMPTGADRTAMMLGEGPTERARLESGLKKMQEITADKSGMAAVKLLTETNAKLESIGKQPITMQELLSGAQQFSALMYPKVGDVAATRERPR